MPDGAGYVGVLHGIPDGQKGTQAVLEWYQALVQAPSDVSHVCHQTIVMTQVSDTTTTTRTTTTTTTAITTTKSEIKLTVGILK